MNYKYDLAISLRDTDKTVAEKITEQLKGRFNIFFYPESQKDIDFRNGVELLPRVYRYEARGVLVLLRPDWGETRWTAIEREALTERVKEDGQNFLLAVRMEKMQTPAWMPGTYFYHQYQEWGFDTLIGSIIGKLGELQAEVRELDSIQIAQQQAAAAKWRTERETLLMGFEGKKQLDNCINELRQIIKEKITKINENIPESPIQIEEDYQGNIALIRNPCSILISKDNDRANPPLIHRIGVDEYNGMISLIGTRSSRKAPEIYQRFTFGIDVNENGDWFWRNVKSGEMITTAKLADAILKDLLTRSGKFHFGELPGRTRRIRHPGYTTNDDLLGET